MRSRNITAFLLCAALALSLFSAVPLSLADWEGSVWSAEESGYSPDILWDAGTQEDSQGSFVWENEDAGTGSVLSSGTDPVQTVLPASQTFLMSSPSLFSVPLLTSTGAEEGSAVMSYVYDGTEYVMKTPSLISSQEQCSGGTAGLTRWTMDKEGNYEITLEKPGVSSFAFVIPEGLDGGTFDLLMIGGGGAGGAGGDNGSHAEHIRNGWGGNGGNIVSASGLSAQEYTSAVTAEVGAAGAQAKSWTHTFCSTSECGCLRAYNTYTQTFYKDPDARCTCVHVSDKDEILYGGNGGDTVFGAYTASGGHGGRGGAAGSNYAENGTDAQGAGSYQIFGTQTDLGFGGGAGYVRLGNNQGLDSTIYHNTTSTAYGGYAHPGYGNGGGGFGTWADYVNDCTYHYASNSAVTAEGSRSGSPASQGIIRLTGTCQVPARIHLIKSTVPDTWSPEGFSFDLFLLTTDPEHPEASPAETWCRTEAVNENGEASFDGLADGTYLIREQPRDGWICGDDQIITVTAGETVPVQFTNLRRVRILVSKTTDDNPPSADLSGFEFEVFSSDDLSGPIETIVTDADGIGTGSWLPDCTGEYVVRETAGSRAGYYEANSQSHTVSVTAVYDGEGKIVSLNPQLDGSSCDQDVTAEFDNTARKLEVSLLKADADLETGAQGCGTLDGAVYELFWYDGSETVTADTAVTSGGGKLSFSPGLSLSRDFFIREVTPSEGYLLDERIYPVTPEWDGETGKYVFHTEVGEQISSAPITIRKADSVTGETPQGDASLSGAVYDVIYAPENDHPYVVFNGQTVGRGETVTSAVTDENGSAVTEALPYGIYRIRERTAPSGYELSDETLTVSLFGESGQAEAQTVTAAEEVRRGQLQIRKGSRNGEITAMQFSGMKNAVFGIRNLSARPVAVSETEIASAPEGVTWSAADTGIDGWRLYQSDAGNGGTHRYLCTVSPGADGVCPAVTLPCGTYQVEEIKAPDLFLSDAEPVSVTIGNSPDSSAVTETVLLDTPMTVSESGVLKFQKKLRNPYNGTPDPEMRFPVRLTLTYHVSGRPRQNLLGAFPLYRNGELLETVTPDEDGIFCFTIAAGETLELRGLPLGIGVKYKAVEGELPSGWSYDIYTSYDLSGDLTASSRPVVLINEYYPTGKVTLQARKVFKGGTIGERQFRFQLLEGKTALMSETFAEPDGTVSFPEITYTGKNIGKTYMYRILEGARTDSGIEYSDRVCEVLVTVSDNHDGTLRTDVTYDGETEIPVFINRDKNWVEGQDGKVTVTKTLEGNQRNLNDRFTFTLTLKNADGTAYTGEISSEGGTGWADAGSGIWTFELGHEESASVTLPEGTRYTVSEDPESYRCTADGVETETVSGTVVSGQEEDTVHAFVNTRSGAVPTGIRLPSLWVTSAIPAAGLIAAILHITEKKKRKAEE